MDSTGGDVLLPPEGVNAAANLFAMIVESELRGKNVASFFIIIIISNSVTDMLRFLCVILL